MAAVAKSEERAANSADGASTSQTPAATPPAYDSLFGRVQTSMGKTETGKRVNKISKSKVFLAVALSVVFAIMISNIVFGSVFLYECPVQTFIPIYLIVDGALTIIVVTFALSKESNPKSEKEKFKQCIFQLGGMALFVLFIAANVMIHGLDWVSAPPSAPKYCHPVLYYYARWFILIPWMVIGLVVLYLVADSVMTACKRLGK